MSHEMLLLDLLFPLEKLTEEEQEKQFFRLYKNLVLRENKDYELVSKAYNTIKSISVGKVRDNGETYISHPRGAALILMVLLRVRDPKEIAAALLHDIVEDFPEYSARRVKWEFGRLTGSYVRWLSKPPLSKSVPTKIVRDLAYYMRLEFAPLGAVRVKLAEHLQNVLSFHELPPEKMKRQIAESIEKILPVAKRRKVLFDELQSVHRRMVNLVGMDNGFQSTK